MNMEILLNEREGISFWVLGDLYTFKATGKQTNGAFTIIDQIVGRDSGPPPHIHHQEDEAFYILDGSFTFLCGEQQNVFEAGSFLYIPRGTIHTFKNTGAHPGRLLVVITPAGLEEFFYAIGTPVTDPANPPPFDPSIVEKLMQLAKKFQMEIVLPDVK
jgi:mannose-6-phosphate isomerase-like protein (cupin superfamily)